jgi:hypothetical protein
MLNALCHAMSLRGSIQFKTTPVICFVFFLGVHCWELVAATQSCKLSLGTVRLLACNGLSYVNALCHAMFFRGSIQFETTPVICFVFFLGVH